MLELEANACSKTVPRKYLKYDPVKTSGYIKADITVAFRQTSRKMCSVSCKCKQAINTHGIVCAAEQTTVETYNGGTIGILESFQQVMLFDDLNHSVSVMAVKSSCTCSNYPLRDYGRDPCG